jgi:hypothetical protein
MKALQLRTFGRDNFVLKEFRSLPFSSYSFRIAVTFGDKPCQIRSQASDFRWSIVSVLWWVLARFFLNRTTR